MMAAKKSPKPVQTLRKMLESRILRHPTYGTSNPEHVAAMTDEELVEEFAMTQWCEGQDSMKCF